MRTNIAFWRNAVLIAAAHIALIIALVRWSRDANQQPQRNVVWMSGAPAEQPIASSANAAPSVAAATPAAVPEQTPEPANIAVKSEIQLPTATPTATPTLTPSPTPRPAIAAATPRPTPRAVPKPSRSPTPKPKKKASPKPTAKPRPTPVEAPDVDDDEGDESPSPSPSAAAAAEAPSAAKHGGSSGIHGAGSGAAGASEYGWYASMLHDRFYSEWNQPTGNIATGAKLAAQVRLRIERDGTVTRFEIARSSGNAAVDQSIIEMGKRVTHVDAVPEGLGSGDHYDVKINFELSQQD